MSRSSQCSQDGASGASGAPDALTVLPDQPWGRISHGRGRIERRWRTMSGSSDDSKVIHSRLVCSATGMTEQVMSQMMVQSTAARQRRSPRRQTQLATDTEAPPAGHTQVCHDRTSSSSWVGRLTKGEPPESVCGCPSREGGASCRSTASLTSTPCSYIPAA